MQLIYAIFLLHILFNETFVSTILVSNGDDYLIDGSCLVYMFFLGTSQEPFFDL